MLWIGFLVFVFAMLALDLGVFHRRSHAVGFREALIWSAVWAALSCGFAVVVYYAYEGHWTGLGLTADPVDGVINDGVLAAQKYLTGYVVEWSLSVDNIFVISLILTSFAVPGPLQHRVLFWGILFAVVLRGAMIGVGATLVAEFHGVLYVFAVFLIVTGGKMLFWRSQEHEAGENRLVRWARRAFKVTGGFHDHKFLVREAAVAGGRPGKLMLTPLALALIMVETSDVVFAVDSIPAIFAITGDPFLVFTSNIFAILGLRSLFFVLAGMVRRFALLTPAIALVLMLVGVKILFAAPLRALLGSRFNLYLLLVVLGLLAGGVVASLLAERAKAAAR